MDEVPQVQCTHSSSSSTHAERSFSTVISLFFLLIIKFYFFRFLSFFSFHSLSIAPATFLYRFRTSKNEGIEVYRYTLFNFLDYIVEYCNWVPYTQLFYRQNSATYDCLRDQVEKNDQNLKFSAPTSRPLI